MVFFTFMLITYFIIGPLTYKCHMERTTQLYLWFHIAFSGEHVVSDVIDVKIAYTVTINTGMVICLLLIFITLQ